MTDQAAKVVRSQANVVLCNVFADDNRGGAAITLESIRAARTVFPDCSIGLVAVVAGADAETHRHTLAVYPDAEVLQPLVRTSSGRLGPLWAVARSLALLVGGGRGNRSLTMKRIRRADFVMSKGGQVFKDRRTVGGLASVWLSCLPLLMGWRLGKRTAIYAATIGPVENTLARPVVGWIIRRADWVFVRDSRSKAEAIGLGVTPNRIVQMPDCVFGRTPPTVAHCASVAMRFGLTPRRYAAVTLQGSARSRPEQHANFLRELASVTKVLLARGVVDRVAVVAQVDGRISSDMKQNRTFLDLCDDARVFLMDADLSPEDMTGFYGAAAMTIGCRVHSVIFSLVTGTPSWVATMGGFKAHDLLTALGLEQFVVSYPEFDVERLTDEIVEQLHRADELRSRIQLAVGDARARVDHARDQLRLAVLSNVDAYDFSRAPLHRGDGKDDVAAVEVK